MKLHPSLACLLLLLPLAAQDGGMTPPVRERVYIGMVADERGDEGLLVRAVAPASPAHKAGVRVGDVLLRVQGNPIKSRDELREIVAGGVRGASLELLLRREGQEVALQVVLEARPAATLRHRQAVSAFGADKHIQPIALPEPIRQEIRRHRRILREQLASLPHDFEPRTVTLELQAIRDLARDAHVSRPGWMSGRAGEISVRFRDVEGSVVLYGANNQVSLELFNHEGQLLSRHELNTEAERSALPEPVLQRLRRFR